MSTIKSLNPRSLVMTINECFYCKKTEEKIRCICVDRLFGVKACDEHKEHAEADMKSYMKKNKIIHVKDGIEIPEVKQLFDFLSDNMKILRTNGYVDSGWKLNKNAYDFIPSFKKVDDVWRFPAIKITEDEMDFTTKTIRMYAMLDERLEYVKDSKFIKLVKDACDTLDSKLDSYKEKSNLTDYSEEHPSISKYVIDGKVVRVFEHVSS